MLLSGLQQLDGAVRAAREAFVLMQRLYPICRSITGPGMRQTLDAVDAVIPLARTEVPSGTPVFDWEVPDEWQMHDAYIADANGRRVIDAHVHSLHIVSYSVPFRGRLTRAELEPHLHSLPEHPDWIPYRTSYYRRDWGFCLRHRDRERLGEGPFDVVVDTDLGPGHLTYAECVIPGRVADEAIVYTHTCHPSLANDNLTGIAVAAQLACALRGAADTEPPRLTWRFIFAPGTIGSLTWLARNEDMLARIRAGLVIGLLGDSGPLTYKRSRRGNTSTDRIAEYILETGTESARTIDFEPYGYDERQFCSPGIDLPVGRLTRSPNGTYAEYHSSADDLSLVTEPQIAGAIRTLARLLATIDANRRLINLRPKGEPRLGKRGLYRSVGGTAPGEFENALLWVLNQSDGESDLLAIARRSGLTFQLIDQAAAALESAQLVRTLEAPERGSTMGHVSAEAAT